MHTSYRIDADNSVNLRLIAHLEHALYSPAIELQTPTHFQAIYNSLSKPAAYNFEIPKGLLEQRQPEWLAAALAKPSEDRVYTFAKNFQHVAPPDAIKTPFDIDIFSRGIIHGATTTLGAGACDPYITKRCLSSHGMSALASIRNTEKTIHPIISIGIKALAELALPFLTVTAIIEAVAYTTLVLGARALSPLTNKPRDFLATLGIYSMQPSALNTIEWTIVSLWDNIMQKTIANSEYEFYINAQQKGCEK